MLQMATSGWRLNMGLVILILKLERAAGSQIPLIRGNHKRQAGYIMAPDPPWTPPNEPQNKKVQNIS